jgi:hypothetical protein
MHMVHKFSWFPCLYYMLQRICCKFFVYRISELFAQSGIDDFTVLCFQEIHHHCALVVAVFTFQVFTMQYQYFLLNYYVGSNSCSTPCHHSSKHSDWKYNGNIQINLHWHLQTCFPITCIFFSFMDTHLYDCKTQ